MAFQANLYATQKYIGRGLQTLKTTTNKESQVILCQYSYGRQKTTKS